MGPAIVLFSVFAANFGNATVFATLGLFGRSIGLTEIEIGAIFASSALLFFLTSSHWGRLSDRIGRTPVMIAGLAGTAVSLFLFAGLYWASWPGGLIGLLVARTIYGCLPAASSRRRSRPWPTSRTAEKRAAGVALVGAAVGIGSIAGPILTAALVGFGLPVPVAVAGVVVALAAAATFFGVRDGGLRPVATSAAPSSIDGLGHYQRLAFAMIVGFGALQPTTAFYVQDRFHLDTALAIREASLASASAAACSLYGAGVRRPGPGPATAGHIRGRVSRSASSASSVASLRRRPDWLIAAFGVLGAGYGLAQSGLTAAASVIGGEHRQGHVAGRLQAVMSAAWIVGALGGTTLYSFSIEAPLVLAAAGVASPWPRFAGESGPGSRRGRPLPQRLL